MPGGQVVAADAAGIARALDCLRRGLPVAFPTETVYGLGADAASAAAVAAVYRIKRRPADHPLIVHVGQAEALAAWACPDERARRLAEAFWPGPLTLVLVRRPEAPAHACAGHPTVGVRCPSHPVAQRLLAAFAAAGGLGIAAPSANRFGRISPTRASHVRDDLGEDVALILDGGDAEIGLESTIVDLSTDRVRLLRPGAITASAIAAVLGTPVAGADAQAPRVPGSLAAHYAPRTPVEVLDAAALEARIAQLRARGLRLAAWTGARPSARILAWLPAPGDPQERGRQLYDTLRRLDGMGADRILVEATPPGEAWDALRDRLARAAAGAGASTP